MKALIFYGSPKRNSHTAQLCSAFLKGLSKSYEVEIVRLFELMPTPCNDCGYCKASDGCSKKDLESVMRSFFEADLVIVASPVYLLSYPAPLKALFDRFQRFYSARFRRGIEKPVQKPKKSVLLLTAGSDGTEAKEIIEAQTKRAFSVMNTTVVATVLAEHTDTQHVNQTVLQQAFSLAKSL